jgi:hypothetical protein
MNFDDISDEDQMAWGEFVSKAHLYKQQYTIDEVKIDYNEFKRRLDSVNFVDGFTRFADKLSWPESEYEKGIVDETLELYNNPPQ